MYRDGAKLGPQVFVFSHTLDTEVLVTVLAQAHPGRGGGGGNFGPGNPTNNNCVHQRRRHSAKIIKPSL